MFSRILEALKKADATTLEVLRDLITSSYTPNPSMVYMGNIYHMKSWIRQYVATFQHHGTPHVFHFKKKMEKVKWKWYTVFSLVGSVRNGYPRRTHLL